MSCTGQVSRLLELVLTGQSPPAHFQADHSRAITPNTNTSQAPTALYLVPKQQVPANQAKTTQPTWRYFPLFARQAKVPGMNWNLSRTSRQ